VPLESESLPNSLRGRRITKSRLIEISYVNVPALESAIVNARGFGRPGRSTKDGRANAAAQRKLWFSHRQAEWRREQAEALEARLRREGSAMMDTKYQNWAMQHFGKQ
jgi:hypothetical protein